MKKQNKAFKSKKQPVFRCVKAILRIFMRKPKRIVNLAGELESKSIIVANHSGKLGPVFLELYFPLFHCMWGAGEMLGNYSSRFHYLRDVFYMQKKGIGKFRATLKAAFESLFSIYFYRGLKILPTFTNAKLLPTINKSVEAINQDVSVLVFPENSNDGYHDVLKEFFPGFVLLAEAYYRRVGVDLPVYPTYYHIKKRILCIGKPLYVHEMSANGMNRNEIAEVYRQKVNELFYNYCSSDSVQN